MWARWMARSRPYLSRSSADSLNCLNTKARLKRAFVFLVPSGLRASVFGGVALHAVDVGLAIGHAARFLTFINHLA